GVGQNVVIDFVDDCRCGAYAIKMSHELRDALLSISSGSLSQQEPADSRSSFGLVRPPLIKFKNLEVDVVNTHVILNPLRFEVTTDAKRATDSTSVVEVTIVLHNKDLVFAGEDGHEQTSINLYGRFTTLTGRVAEVFEDTVDVGRSEPASETTTI